MATEGKHPLSDACIQLQGYLLHSFGQHNYYFNIFNVFHSQRKWRNPTYTQLLYLVIAWLTGEFFVLFP